MENDETGEPETPSALPTDEDIALALSSLGGVASLAVRHVQNDASISDGDMRAILAGILSAAVNDLAGNLSEHDVRAGLFYGEGLYAAIKLNVGFGPEGMQQIIMASLDNLCRQQDRTAAEIRYLVDSAKVPDEDDENDYGPDEFQEMLDDGPVQAAEGAAAFFAATVAGMRLIESMRASLDSERMQRMGWRAEVDARLAFARDNLTMAASAAIHERRFWDQIRQGEES